MVRILSSIFYISSIRKTSEKFNSSITIENVGYLCGEELQEIINKLVYHLIQSKAFNDARIRSRYWQIIIDCTQIHSSRKELDGQYLYRIHNKGTEKEYKEYYYYVLEAKLVLADNICVSIMTEFVENKEKEIEKQDCELKACWRLMDKLKQRFPMLPICINADSLYACDRFFEECEKRKWKYILRFQEKRIPTIFKEYEKLSEFESNKQEEIRLKEKKEKNGSKKTEKIKITYDYVNDTPLYNFFSADYNLKKINDAQGSFML